MREKMRTCVSVFEIITPGTSIASWIRRLVIAQILLSFLPARQDYQYSGGNNTEVQLSHLDEKNVRRTSQVEFGVELALVMMQRSTLLPLPRSLKIPAQIAADTISIPSSFWHPQHMIITTQHIDISHDKSRFKIAIALANP